MHPVLLQYTPQIVWLCSSSTSVVDRLFEGNFQELPKERLQEAVAKYVLCAILTSLNANAYNREP